MKLTNKDYFIFSGGEVHSKLSNMTDVSRIVCLDYTMNGFMALCEHKEILDRRGLYSKLIYPYFPYARQDRVMNDDEPFSLKVFCGLLNSQKFNYIEVWDPHSDVVPALVDNCRIIPQWQLAAHTLPKELLDDPNVIFVSPDAGAYKKVAKLIPNDYRIALGTKVRGTDGDIIRTSVYSPCDLKDKTCVIVDDICDGGKTFVELAKALRHKGAGKIILYVTHGIFSKGFSELNTYINHIYTTNSFPSKAQTKLVTVKEFI